MKPLNRISVTFVTLSLFAFLVSGIIAFRSGVLRRQYVSVGRVENLLAANKLIGSKQDQIVAFLNEKNIEYHLSKPETETSDSSAPLCDQLTAVVPNSSKGLLTVGDIRIEFRFDKECRLNSYHVKEHITVP